MIVPGSVNTTYQDRGFEWFEGQVQMWGLQDYFVTEAIAQNLLRKPGITTVQLNDIDRDKDKYIRV